MGRQSEKSKRKTRTCYCQTCEVRHTAPTGAKCTRSLEHCECDPETESSVGSCCEGDTEPIDDPRTGRQSETEQSEAESMTGKSDTNVILAKLAELATERAADKAEFTRALQALAERIDAPVLSSEDEEPELVKDGRGRTGEQTLQRGQRPFARPMSQQAVPVFAPRLMSETLKNVADPIAKLREDGATAAQAQLILGTSGISLPDLEGINMRSGFYRNANDLKLFEVPWPNDFIFRSNGKKATYDTLSVPEFVVGYCGVIIANLSIMQETRVASDHFNYLSDMVSDIEGGEWEHVRNSHRQVLHQVEQGQLIWEDAAARDAFRGKTLQRAERAAGMGKCLKVQQTQPNGMGMPRGNLVVHSSLTGVFSQRIIKVMGKTGFICVQRA